MEGRGAETRGHESPHGCGHYRRRGGSGSDEGGGDGGRCSELRLESGDSGRWGLRAAKAVDTDSSRCGSERVDGLRGVADSSEVGGEGPGGEGENGRGGNGGGDLGGEVELRRPGGVDRGGCGEDTCNADEGGTPGAWGWDGGPAGEGLQRKIESSAGEYERLGSGCGSSCPALYPRLLCLQRRGVKLFRCWALVGHASLD